jgi:hemophore-related protein
MLFFHCAARRLVAGGICIGATVGAMLFGAAGLAMADPEPAPAPAPAQPNCTAADLAGVAAGVAANTSGYLFAHPDVNDYFTSLKGQPRSDIRDQLQDYMNANPQVHADLQGIRQPLTDMQNRCQIVGD